MDDGAGKVVNHQVNNGLNLLLGVGRVVGERLVPDTTVEHQAGQIHGSSSNLAGGELHEAVVKQGNLHEVLADGAGLDVIVVRLGDASEKVHGVGVAKVVFQGAQDKTLGTEDFRLAEAVVGDALEVFNVGGEDLFVLGGNEHGSDADQLEVIELHHLFGEEAIDNVDSEEKGLGKKVEAGVDLNQPINEDTTRLPLEIVLVAHVVVVGDRLDLQLVEILKDFGGVFGNHQGVVEIIIVNVGEDFLRSGLDGGRFLRSLGSGLLNVLVGNDAVFCGVGSLLANGGSARASASRLGFDGSSRSLLGFLGGESRAGGGGAGGSLLDTSGRSLGDEANLAGNLLAFDGIGLGHVAHISEGGTLAEASGGGGAGDLFGLESSLDRHVGFVDGEGGSLGSGDGSSGVFVGHGPCSTSSASGLGLKEGEHLLARVFCW